MISDLIFHDGRAAGYDIISLCNLGLYLQICKFKTLCFMPSGRLFWCFCYCFFFFRLLKTTWNDADFPQNDRN